jgi:putative FmdB family regulatory protein
MRSIDRVRIIVIIYAMPLYEYQCSKCEKVHEVMQKFSDDPWIECPECQGPVSKLMSLTSFSLKGTGWYTTDFDVLSSVPVSASKDSSSQGSGSTPAQG